MKRLPADWRPLAAIGVVLLVTAGLIVAWTLQGWSMRNDFIRAARDGKLQGVHRDLQGKRWTEEELDTAEVITLPDDPGGQRAITRQLFTRGRDVISSQQYAYQATILDSTTGIVHVFGYQRRDPQQWGWAGIHPSNTDLHLRRHMESLQQMNARTK